MNALYSASAKAVRCRGFASLSGRYAGTCFHRPQDDVQAGTTLSTRRTFSSSSPKLEQDDERTWALLYHRNPSRSSSPRAMLGMSTFNLTYWTWYVVDFTPSINASTHEKAALGQIDPATVENFLVDPTMGFVGLGIGSIIWLGSFLYTRQLVSAIWASQPKGDGDDIALAVSTLKLPFLTQPKILERTVYDPDSNAFDGVENIVFTEPELKAESSVAIYKPGELTMAEDQKKHDVVMKLHGEFSRLKGHIALNKEDANGEALEGVLGSLLKQKYLIEINSEDEVMPNASATLLHTLVIKDPYMVGGRRGHNESKKSNHAEANAVKERKASRPKRTGPRPISQLEMARGTLKDSVNRKKGR